MVLLEIQSWHGKVLAMQAIYQTCNIIWKCSIFQEFSFSRVFTLIWGKGFFRYKWPLRPMHKLNCYKRRSRWVMTQQWSKDCLWIRPQQSLWYIGQELDAWSMWASSICSFNNYFDRKCFQSTKSRQGSIQLISIQRSSVWTDEIFYLLYVVCFHMFLQKEKEMRYYFPVEFIGK